MPLNRRQEEKCAEPLEPPAAGSGVADRTERRRPRRWRRAAFVVLLVAAVAVGGACLWFWHLVDGRVSRRDFEATVVIVRGTPYSRIVAQLREAELLPYPLAFDYLAWRRGDSNRLKPGRYRLRSSMSVRDIYEAMIAGAPIRVTVPEGWTLDDIAARLVSTQLLEEAEPFVAAARDPEFLRRHRIEGASAEGYLMPETYSLDPGAGPHDVLETMVREFERRYAAQAATSRPASLTWHQLVTLASMIEREARNDDEKAVIASVYYNRLARGMSLDCDATIRYALSKWRGPLTRSDLKVDSPYNTYLNEGLPPGPICCVGRSSLDAALGPAQSEFLYYCLKGKQGHVFSKTLSEHQEAVRKFLRKGLTPETPKR